MRKTPGLLHIVCMVNTEMDYGGNCFYPAGENQSCVHVTGYKHMH